MESHLIDGSLAEWREVEGTCSGGILLVGNGLSTHVWRDFGFRSLYERATAGSLHGTLTSDDQALFSALETENFERVLAELSTTIRVTAALSGDTAALFERYRSVQAALASAVRAVHVTRSEVPDHALRTIKEVLQTYEWVFTTNYDLLIYWAMGFGNTYGKLCDCFWSGGRNEFDSRYAEVRANHTPVYFLHGALHLVVMSSGVTRKLTATSLETILDQFGRPVDGDNQARPLIVTEGSFSDKLRAIDDNEYLGHALNRLRSIDLPVVVFGSSLGPQDQHLIDALNEFDERPIAVSLLPGRTGELRKQQAELRGRLDAKPLLFFDASTHPLGDSALTK